MSEVSRRELLKTISVASVGLAATPALAFAGNESKKLKLKGRIHHSVCSWTYGYLTLPVLCQTVKKIGFNAIDLVSPKDWHILKKAGVECSMCNGAEIGLSEGWNDKKHHAKLISNYKEHIELVKKAGYKNLICFTGNRNGMDDETGLQNCAEGLKQIMSLAEKSNVVIQLELFNSKIDHKDYMADKSTWGVELCKRIGSPNFKLLYDIYHMQINEGDVIRTIQENHQYFGHYHTAGVPGRHEINDTQELYYPAIMKAILKTGFSGYVAQEFIPTGKTSEEKINSLKDAVKRCDV
jgi:hydroxypyruvate isomerase